MSGFSGNSGVAVSITPTWSGGGTPPSLGNGTLTGSVTRLGPALLQVSVKLTFGSTTTPGTSYWQFALPAPYNSNATAFGSGNSLMVHGGGNFTGLVTNGSGSGLIFPFYNGNLVTSTVPFTWVTGDTLEFGFLMTGP